MISIWKLFQKPLPTDSFRKHSKNVSPRTPLSNFSFFSKTKARNLIISILNQNKTRNMKDLDKETKQPQFTPKNKKNVHVASASNRSQEKKFQQPKF